MTINLPAIFTEAVTLYGDYEVDVAELEGGATSVPLPAFAQVGTTGGKPIYLSGSLTTVKPPNGTPFPGGFSIASVFDDAVIIEGDISVDEALLAAGDTVALPTAPQIGSVDGTPVYLVASLSTTKPEVAGGLEPA
jgi:hypothetical protein